MDSEYIWYNDLSKKFLTKDYLLPNQTLSERIDVIANTAEQNLKIKGFANTFKHYMKKGFISLSSPIWSNYGTLRGLPISCFGSKLDDSMESILHTQAEVGMMTKYGGGTSADFSSLRSRGSDIKDNGKSSGAVHFIKGFDTNIGLISQGNTRRGNFAAYLDVDHKDIEEFLTIRSEGSPIQDITFGVNISDEWMNQMIMGDSKKRHIWAKILEKRRDIGFPYIFFTDNANKNLPEWFSKHNLKVHHSNLCVTGDQRIPSNYGLLTAKELYELEKDLILFDNSKLVNSSPMKLIEKDAEVFKITLDNGMSHTITSYHKVCVLDKDSTSYQTKNTACKDLRIGDAVAIQTNKGLFGNNNMPKEAFLLGLYQADGTQYKDYIALDIWENDFDLLDIVQEYHDYICDVYETQKSNNRLYNSPKFHDCIVQEGSDKKKRLIGKALKKSLNFEKGYVPDWIWQANELTQWEYIKGLYYADGSVFKSTLKGEPLQISLASIDKEFLQEIQLLLANLGMQSSIRLLRKEGYNLLPDGKGEKDYYLSKECYRLLIGNKNDALVFEKNTKFLSRKKVYLEDREYRDNTKKFYSIISIEYVGKEDVYCTTVDSKEHLFICNGIVTHNCTEIMLPNSYEESFVCDLLSLNILHYDLFKNDQEFYDCVVFLLDAVMSEFIDKAKEIKFMERTVKFAERHRALGIGWLGWHSYLQSNMIPFESMEAKLKNVQIANNIKNGLEKASYKASEIYGEPYYCKGYGRRNSTLQAIAPTTSSSWILGQVSKSIEPELANVFIKDLAKGKETVENKYLLKILGDKYEKYKASILYKGGSVQHLDCLSENEKKIFKTFSEISQMEIVIQAAQRQKYIDQGQSLNVAIHPSTSPKEVSQLYIEGWKQGIKSFYYQIGVNAAQEFSRNILQCSSCES